MSNDYDFDAAVIGAGPSGSRAARLLAEQGHRVALLERNSEVGLPVHCTGIVSRECMEQYDLPPELILHPADSFVLWSPHGHDANLQRRTVQAFVLDRVGLDRHLAAQVQEAGAELHTSMDVRSLSWLGHGMAIEGLSENGGFRLTARLVVLATGFGSPLARPQGFSNPGEVLSGCQAVVSVQDLDQVEVFTGSMLGRGGFGWLVPWRPGLALAGVITRAHAMHYMQSHIRRLQEAGRVGHVQETFRCRPIPLGVASHSVADGVIGIGDVVGQVKPTTGGGIYFGLMGADLAAQTAHTALVNGNVTAQALLPYQQQWRALMEPEIRGGYMLRRLCEQLPETVVEHLHRLLRVPTLRQFLISAQPSFDWHSGPLLRVLNRFQRHGGVIKP